MPGLIRLSEAEAGYLSRLAARSRAVPVSFQGAEWEFRLHAMAGEEPLREPFHLGIDLGGSLIGVAVDRAVFQELLRAVDPGGEVSSMPEPLLLALAELAFAELADRLQQACGHAVRIAAAGPDAQGAPEAHRLAFTLRQTGGGQPGADRTVAGELALDARGLAVVSGLAGRQPPGEAGADWEALPVPLRFDVGWVDLAAGDLAALARHDVILLDDATLLDEDRLLVRVSARTMLRARLSGSSLIIENSVSTIMTEDPAAPAEPLLDTLEEVEVRLTFDIGQQSVTLAELRRIAAGTVFDLGRDPRRAVNIRANGRLVGTGELVRIEERIGVRVTRVSGAPE